jgi:hypothetical protein
MGCPEDFLRISLVRAAVAGRALRRMERFADHASPSTGRQLTLPTGGAHSAEGLIGECPPYRIY